jgi:CheY-like chemotaxis protein
MPVLVLVVDDEHAVADTLRLIMEQAGFAALSAYSGADAIRLAREFPPDILVSDILMPDLNGFELGLRIKETFPQCRLLFFSGQTATLQMAERYTDIFAAKQCRFVLLPKPVDPDVLLHEIQQALVTAA